MKLPKFKSKAFLAPMAGITNAAFRRLCSENGAGLTITELTSVHAVAAKGMELVQYSDNENPRSVQLFGNKINLIVKAAKIVKPYFDMIDFNMGCPAPHITDQEAGAALMQKPEHVKELLSSLVSSVNKPVTLKMRAGNSRPDKFLEIGKIAEECGVSMITLHPRTVKQRYSGKADWELIKKLKESISIPVVGNGDINTPEDVKSMMEQTGCDFVMIGRAARGNPYIFKQIKDYLKNGKYDKINYNKRLDGFKKYIEYSKDFKVKISDIKGHAMNFSKGVEGGAELRRMLSKAKTKEEIKKILRKPKPL